MKNILFNNTKLKILAIFCAFILWFYVNIQKETKMTRSFDVKINFSNIPENTKPICELEKVRIKISGTRIELLNKISKDLIFAKVDLTTFSEGNHKNIPIQIFGQFNKKDLLSFKPETVDFQLIKSFN